MARFYAEYTNATVSALEVIDSSNSYQRKTVNTTNAGTARTSMISTRSTLSASMYSSIDTVNENGTLGIVVPADAYTNNGTTFSGANLYTNTVLGTSAAWQSDPRVRPNTQILISNSTVVSPADTFSVPTADYNAARTAVQDYYTAVTGGSPYARLGLNPWRTLASIWHDHSLTYFAWDDFTPGRMSGFAETLISGVGEPEQFRFTGTFEFANDYNPDARVELIASLVGPTTYNLNTLVTPTSSSFSYDWLPNGVSSVTAGSYTLTVTARVRDPVIITHFGASADDTNSYNFPI
jgi:hypothetical protein